jgi:hypothetical protein
VEPLNVWTANVKYLAYNWRMLIGRIAQRERKPHLLLLQEADRADARRLRAVLTRRFPGRFGVRWVQGDNAVLWKKERLDLTDRRTARRGPRNTLRWKSWGNSNSCTGRDRGEIALRLWDSSRKRAVVAASVRWTHTTANACMVKNLRSLNRKLERTWPRRRMTIVGGDFNSVAERRSRAGGSRDVLAAGKERDPDCWYRTFSRLRGNRLRQRRPGEGNRDCSDDRFFSHATDTYYDTVWLASRREGRNAICRSWTYTRKLRARRGTACTDRNGDGYRDRSRLDYIWVRWEKRSGDPVALSRAAATLRVGSAGPDAVCIDGGCSGTRYSDHRAVHATIR